MPNEIINAINNTKNYCELLKKTNDKFEREEAINFINKNKNKDPFIMDILGTIYLEGKYIKKDVNKARACFEAASKNRYAMAYYHLGYLYFLGIGCKTDYNKSYNYLYKAYKAGNIESNLYLGISYYYGYGTMRSYNHAFKCFCTAAKNNIKESYFYIGLSYYYGRGVSLNYIKAKHWFDKEHNNDSLYYLGLIYLNGYLNGKPNYDEAYKCFSHSAGLKNKDAFIMVGDCYLNGYGVLKDVLRALEIYREGYAELNISKSYAKLGYAYIYSEEISHDIKKGLTYLKKGAKLNCPECNYYLGKYYSDDINIRPNYNLAEQYFLAGVSSYDEKCCYSLALIEKEKNNIVSYEKLLNEAVKLGSNEAKLILGKHFIKNDKSYTRSKGFMYLKDVSKSYNNEALFNLGMCYLKGIGIKKNSKKALKYFLLACENGNIESYYYIARLYDSNKIVKIDHEKALEYYKLGHENENMMCTFILGKRYIEGKVINKDFEKGIEYINDSKIEINQAYYYLAKLYDDGKYVSKNEEEAFKYLEEGLKYNNSDCIFMLGFYYYKGTYVKKDKSKALELFKKARSLGNLEAKKMLGEIR